MHGGSRESQIRTRRNNEYFLITTSYHELPLPLGLLLAFKHLIPCLTPLLARSERAVFLFLFCINNIIITLMTELLIHLTLESFR
uniref:Uncharacterized protein n=1 Tax=Picea glauca TaxID=3330 RepID=A0A101M5C7_PICGL|nr:hypothetical protein ABT39_MTgene1130 [Picea glauca]QHR87464.1 hypothetical protein Q903MT_gene1475 [Picea sitchensis]